MGKQRRAKNEAKKAQREAEKAARAEAKRQAELAAAKRRRVLIAIPALTLLVAAGTYFGLNDARLTGVAVLVGGLLWLTVGLAGLGSSIQPRDRSRAGSIDFGTKE